MTPAVIAVVVAAVAGAPHCLGMCGALAVAGAGPRGWLPYHVGRVATYTLLGALAGGFGGSLPGPSWVVAVSSVFLVGFAAALAGLVPEPTLTIPGLPQAAAALARRAGPAARLGFGALNGLLPCGLLYATLAVPVSTGSAVQGASLMALFGAITALPLTAAGFGLRPLLRHRGVRIVMASAVLVTGLYGLSGRVVADTPDAEPACPHHGE